LKTRTILVFAGSGLLVALVCAITLAVVLLRPTRGYDPSKDLERVTVSELIDEYASNEISADKRYRGYPIEARGTVAAVERDPRGGRGALVMLGPLLHGRLVACFFANADDAEGFKVGSVGTVRGIGAGAIPNGAVRITDCEAR
jgi:hypothetical protein